MPPTPRARSALCRSLWRPLWLSLPLVPTGASDRRQRLRVSHPTPCPFRPPSFFHSLARQLLTLSLAQANLASALSGPGPFTVFAPTNEAFVAALGALKLSKQQLLDLPTLSNILKFHVVSGKVMSSQLSNGMEAATLEGSKVKFEVGSAGVKVNGAKVVTADIVVDNGVIHVISSVMLPPQKPADYIKGMAGISAPFGLFDPAGFLNDQSIPEVKRLRESEIVHGRLAMLAALGFLVGESGATPLFNGDIQGLAINQFQQVPAGFEAAVTLAIGIAEAGRASKGWVEPGNGLFTLRDSYAPGDLGFDPLGLKPTVAADLKDMQTKEINNGRLAMLAIGAWSILRRSRHLCNLR